MAILKSDIKLVASQVMADTPNGGGAPTTTIIADAVSNALFPDISELDRAAGRVNLRKVFVHVQTPTVDNYFGANVVVAEPPQDPNVSVTIFSNREVFDRRTNAQNRVEAYLNVGPLWGGMLYENHLAGQRVIQICQRPTVALPPVGRTLVLLWHPSLGDEKLQYVRVTRVDSEIRTFTDDQGDFQAMIVTCDLSDVLRYDFIGTAANRRFAADAGATGVRDTVVADAGNYFGVVPLSSAAVNGDASVVAESIYTQLVPSARTEMSIIDARPANSVNVVLAASPREVVVPTSPLSQRIRVGQENRGFNFVTMVKPLPAPGSVRVAYRALGNTYYLTDDGAGALRGDGSGVVNYLTGSISVTLQALPDDRSAIVFFYGPKTGYTSRAGSVAYRAPDHTFSLEHQNVTPSSLTVTWESGGVTKTATDNGTGKLTGDADGEIYYPTGLLFIRPKYMLDAYAEYSVDYTWKTLVQETFPGITPDGSGVVSVTLAQTPAPGTVTAEWASTVVTSASSGVTVNSNSTNKTNMAHSSAGNTTVTSTAMVDTTKTFRAGAGAAEVKAAYQAPLEEGYTVVATPEFGIINTLGQYGWVDNSYTVTQKKPVTTTTSTSTTGTGSSSTSNGATYSTASQQTSRNGVTISHVATDDGAGNFFGTLGTLNYAGKTFTLKVQADYTERTYQSNHEEAKTFESLNDTGESTTTTGGAPSTSTSSGGGGSTSAQGGETGSSAITDQFSNNSLMVSYQTGSPTPTAATESFQPPGVSIDLLPRTDSVVVPGSVKFTWMGHTYEDYQGFLYRDVVGSVLGPIVGRVVYTKGHANIHGYLVGGSPQTVTINSLWTRDFREHVANVVFLTTAAPVKPTGLVVSVIDIEGDQLIATAALDGKITGTHAHGMIDYETGLVEIQFGDYVLDSGLTAKQKAEWWYNADDVRVSDGKIWKPWPIDPDTVRYNAAAYKYLPLDASIIGLDPVRLPSDGRVPIFRAGSFAVVGHTATVGPVTVSNGQTINCARVRLSRVRVLGADGHVINSGYTEDLELGHVTFTNVTGYSQPVTLEHRVEDMALVSDAQISGRLSFTRQLTHDYPVPGSYVSSALVAGDMQTYVSAIFDQVTWTGVWADSQTGSAATGTYNDVLAPIEVTNEGAVTERWYVRFTNTTTFDVIGEHVGLIATGNTSTDLAPVNPATGHPYFTLRAVGWGGGWSNGNVLRFNTVGTIFPVWVVRTVQQGPETVAESDFTLLVRGDVDRP